MAQWRKWVFLSAVVIAMVVMAVFLSSKREPTYQGRSLSSWLEIYGSELDNSPDDQKGAAAIRRIGTNSLPFLLKWTRYEPPQGVIHRAFKIICGRLPDDFLPKAVENWMLPNSKEERAYNAALAFALFKDDTQLVIPQLSTLMNDRKSPNASRTAVLALASVGHDAIPVLSAQLANTNAPNRRFVVLLCGLRPALATNVDLILPQLIRCLDDQDTDVRIEAGRSLVRIAQRYQLQPDVVVPALTNCLRASAPISLRSSAIIGLGKYGVQARAAMPILLQLTADPDNLIRSLATNALMSVSPETLTNSASLR